MKDNYSKSMSMICSTCGGNEFEYDNEAGPFRCTGCDRIYASGDDLIQENGGRIDQQVEDTGKRVMKDLQKDLDKVFKKFR